MLLLLFSPVWCRVSLWCDGTELRNRKCILSQTSYSQNKQKNERGHKKTLSHGHGPINVKRYLHLPGHLAQHALGESVGCPAREEKHIYLNFSNWMRYKLVSHVFFLFFQKHLGTFPFFTMSCDTWCMVKDASTTVKRVSVAKIYIEKQSKNMFCVTAP